MKNLVYRDWMLIKNSRTIYLACLYLLFLIPSYKQDNLMIQYSTNFLFLFIVYLFFSYLTAYDYKYNGLTFTAALPVNKKDIVISRYVFIALSFVVYLFIYVLIKVITYFVTGEVETDLFYKIGIYVNIFTVFFSIIIPLYYKIGYQKMRWIMFIAMFIAIVLSSLLQQITIQLDEMLFLFISTAVSFIIYCISIEISFKIIMNKDL